MKTKIKKQFKQEMRNSFLHFLSIKKSDQIRRICVWSEAERTFKRHYKTHTKIYFHRRGVMILYLQTRWKLQGKKLVYYGLRQKHNMFKNIKLNFKTAKLLVNGFINMPLKGQIKKLYKNGTLVEKENVKKIPASFSEAKFCIKCAMNDFMVPGVEFSKEGLCPVCTAKFNKKLVSILPVVKDIPKSKKSKYDVAVFYTGGKDSTFLLYYLSMVKKLRVLALTWHIPFMSDTALESIKNAKTLFSDVDFIIEKIEDDGLAKVYKKLMILQNNPCACPSLAYFLFYKLLIKEKIPFLILGNEPAQMKNLYYNKMAPKIAYKASQSRFFNFLISIPRILTFRRPFKRGQFHMMSVVKQLAFGKSKLKDIAGYKNQLVDDVCIALKEAPELIKEFKQTVKKSIRKGTMPALVHIDFNEISDGRIYNWNKVKELLKIKTGWSPKNSKGLHTSCKIERVKEYSQFKKFYDMESTLIPFSAMELSIAVGEGSIAREQAIEELKNYSGFNLKKPDEYKYIDEYFEKCNC